MSDPEQNVVEMVTDLLKRYQQDGGDSPLVMGFISQEEDIEVFAYCNCSYLDLRRLAIAIQDEAVLKMIAVNQDRIERFKEENDNAD